MDLHAAAPAAATRPAALDAPTLCHAFQLTAAERPGRDRAAHSGRPDRDHVARVRRAGRADRRRARRPRRGRGDAVGLMLLNRPEFHLVDTAVLHLGAVPFSVYNTSHARAGRRPVPQRRQPGRGHRAPLPRHGAASRARDPAGRAGRPTRRRRRRHHQPRRARGDRAEQLPLRRDLAGGRAGRPRGDHLHLGHHRRPKGVELTHARRAGRVRRLRRALPAAGRRAHDLLPARPRTSSTAGAATGGLAHASASASPRWATRAR